MSGKAKKNLGWVLGGFLFLSVFVFALNLASFVPAPEREIRLVAKEMVFYLEGETTPNPSIALKPGEKVRLHLSNQDPGMMHDLVFSNFGIATEKISYGESTFLEFRVPAAPHSEYFCSFHPIAMRGRILADKR